MKVRILLEAQEEVIRAALWYRERESSLGTEFVEEIERTFDEIRSKASLSKLETYNGPHEIGRVLVRRFPYVVIILSRPQERIVIAVAHTKRRPRSRYWLERLK